MIPKETREHLLSVIKIELADLKLLDFNTADEGELHLAYNSAERLLDCIKKLKEEDYND